MMNAVKWQGWNGDEEGKDEKYEDKYKPHESSDLLFYPLMTPECRVQYSGHNRNSKTYLLKKKGNVSSSATTLWLELVGTSRGHGERILIPVFDSVPCPLWVSISQLVQGVFLSVFNFKDAT